MIIAVQGTHYGNNESVKVLNALAVMGVATDQLNTMILQFTNKTRKSSEQYLIGKTLRNESLVQDASVPDISSGMDALCAHVFGQDDNARFFSEVSRSLVVASKDRNVFDVVAVSRKESFEKEILNKQRKPHVKNEEFAPELQDQDYLEHLLDTIDNVYKVVYVLMPSKNQALCQEILKYADINIICLHQGNVEPVTHGGKREFYIATDYCNGSAYSTKALAQMYGQKIVYCCSHDIQYNDACANGTALDYLKNNLKADSKSAGYSLIHNIETLYNAIMRKTGRKTVDNNPDELVNKYEGPHIMRVDWTPITESVVREIVTTGGFKKQSRANVMLEPNPNAPTYEAPVFATADTAGVSKPSKNAPVFEEDVDDTPVAGVPDDPMAMPDFGESFADLQVEIPPMEPEEPVFGEEFEIDDSVDEEPELLIPEPDFVPAPEPVPEPQAKPAKKKGLFGGFGKKEKKAVVQHQDGELPPVLDDFIPGADEIPLDDSMPEDDYSAPEPSIIMPEFDDPTPVDAGDYGDIELPVIEDFIDPDPEPTVIRPEPNVITPEEPVKKARKPRAKKAETIEDNAEAPVKKTRKPRAKKADAPAEGAATPVAKPAKAKASAESATDTTDDGWLIG